MHIHKHREQIKSTFQLQYNNNTEKQQEQLDFLQKLKQKNSTKSHFNIQ